MIVEIRPGVSQASIDAILAEPRDIEKSMLAAGMTPVRAKQVVGGGTLFVEGAPKVVAGIIEVGPGVGLAWMLSSIDVAPHVRPLLRSIRRGMQQAEDRGFKLMAQVATSSPTAISFIEHLGFTPTGHPDLAGHRFYHKRK